MCLNRYGNCTCSLPCEHTPRSLSLLPGRLKLSPCVFIPPAENTALKHCRIRTPLTASAFFLARSSSSPCMFITTTEDTATEALPNQDTACVTSQMTTPLAASAFFLARSSSLPCIGDSPDKDAALKQCQIRALHVLFARSGQRSQPRPSSWHAPAPRSASVPCQIRPEASL